MPSAEAASAVADKRIDYPYDPSSVKYSKANNPWSNKTTGEIEKEVGKNLNQRKDDDRFLVYQFEYYT